MGIKEIHDGIYLIGSSGITDAKDCCVYLLNLGELVLIDAGAGAGSSVNSIITNIDKLWIQIRPALNNCPDTLPYRPHRRASRPLQQKYGARIVMHQLDAVPCEKGDQRIDRCILVRRELSAPSDRCRV